MAQLQALRDEYKAATGKNASPAWNAEILDAKLGELSKALRDDEAREAEAESERNREEEARRSAERAAFKAGLVSIVVTVPHVYLPLDEEGNGRADWQNAGETTKVEKRARLMVPADLAKFLSERDQAEVF